MATNDRPKTLFVFDTDMGADDALALYLASRWIKSDIVILTAFGNVPEDQAYENAYYLNRAFGLNAPLFRGAAKSLSAIVTDAKDVHGEDGLGGATEGLRNIYGAVPEAQGSFDALVDYISSGGYDAVDWLAIGPATNLALFLEHGPIDKLGTVTLMSGAVFEAGNITPYAEFNAYADATALDRVLTSGVPLTLVPLDICKKVQLRLDELEASFSSFANEAAVPLLTAHRQYCSHYLEWEGFEGCFPHDSIALAVALGRSGLAYLSGAVSAVTEGERIGATDFNHHADGVHRIAMGGDLKELRRSLLHPDQRLS